MKVTYDVSGLPEFEGVFFIKDYWVLMDFCKRFTKRFYDDRGIYYENHHLYPELLFKASTSKDDYLRRSKKLGKREKTIEVSVPLPFAVHVYAHYLLAREYEDVDKTISNKNYVSINLMLGKPFNHKVSDFSNVSEMCEVKRRSLEESVRVLVKSNAVGKRSKRVICLNDKKVYRSILEAASSYGIGRQHVRKSCREDDFGFRGLFFAFYEDGVDYDGLYETRKTNYEKEYVVFDGFAKKKQDLRSMAKFERRPVICLNTARVYEDQFEMAEDLGIAPGSFDRSLRDPGSYTVKGYYLREYVEDVDYDKVFEEAKYEKRFRNGKCKPVEYALDGKTCWFSSSKEAALRLGTTTKDVCLSLKSGKPDKNDRVWKFSTKLR